MLSYDNIVYNFNQCTNTEIDFLIHIGQYQSQKAAAGGFDYRTICDRIDTAKSNFYKIKDSLVAKGFILAESEWDNWKFQIMNNEQVFNGGRYLDLNHELLHSREFQNLKKNEKIICLKLLERSSIPKAGKELKSTYAGLCELTGVTLKTVMGYVENLKKLFKDMCRTDDTGFYIINKLDGHETKVEGKKSLFAKRPLDQRILARTQFLKDYCKKNKIKYDDRELEDTAALFKQYANLIPEETAEDKELFILDKISVCIKQNKKIIAAYINTLISNALKRPAKPGEEEAVYVPGRYKESFLPYIYCYERENMRSRIEELLGDTYADYYGNPAGLEVLKITIDNLTAMLTSAKTIKAKNAWLTNRQIYERLIAVSSDAAEAASPERFIAFIKGFIDEVVRELPKYNIKSGVEGYLQTWLIDSMNKRLSHL